MHNGAALYAKDAGKLDGLAPQAYIQPQESLFINWNFKNPVNQQNKTNYAEIGYCIDMWQLGKSQSVTSFNLELTPNGVILEPGVALAQYFESIPWQGEFLTIAVQTDEKLYTASWKWNKAAEYEAAAIWDSLAIFYSQTYKYIQIFNLSAQNITLQAAKLEYGSYFTGWPVWNYAQELAKCQRYQFYISRFCVCSSNNNGSALDVLVPLPVTMRTIPVCEFFSMDTIYFDGNVYEPSNFTYSQVLISADCTCFSIRFLCTAALPPRKTGTAPFRGILKANL